MLTAGVLTLVTALGAQPSGGVGSQPVESTLEVVSIEIDGRVAPAQQYRYHHQRGLEMLSIDYSHQQPAALIRLLFANGG